MQKLKEVYPVPKFSVYLIDNSESAQLSLEIFDDLAEELEKSDIELMLVQGHGNVGYGKGHNLVLDELESKYHLLLNPDIQLDESCLTQGFLYFESNEQVVLETPHAYYESGEKQYLCKRYPSVFTFFVRGFFPVGIRSWFKARLAKYEMHELPENEPSQDIPIASGCFMLCRTEALKRINGFDEAYFLYFEDFDLSLRMGKTGKLAYVPAMRIQHTGGNAAGKGFAHLRMFIKSGFRFFNTHGWRFFRQAG